MILRCLLLLTLAVLLPATLQPVTAADNTGPWDLPTLKQTPAAEFGTPDEIGRAHV